MIIAKVHPRSMLFCATTVLGLLATDIAAAARGGGGGRAASSGRMAQSSVSGANRVSTGNVNAGNRANTGNINSGNRVNTGNVNTGNRVNTGNINTGNVNIGNDVNVNIDGGYGYHGGAYYHPIAAGVTIGAVAATTAAVIGSYYRTLPPGCTVVVRGGVSYHYCGSVYYQQTWSGNDVVYVVVQP